MKEGTSWQVATDIAIGHDLIDQPWWQTDNIWQMTKEIIMKFQQNFRNFHLEILPRFENEESS